VRFRFCIADPRFQQSGDDGMRFREVCLADGRFQQIGVDGRQFR
jgi:hypothetical protein